MNEIFDWCVRLLVLWAGWLGITYKEINVWIFVILWPIATAALLAVIAVQRAKIRRLMKERVGQQGFTKAA
jgi:hypothetical protein